MKALVVDDSVLYRQFVRNALSDIEGVEVVGHASSGISALAQIEALQPDVIVLDIHMPEMDGVQVLQDLFKREHRPAVIVLTSVSESSFAMTTTALQLGAFDFVLKPGEDSPEANHMALVAELQPRIEAIGRSVDPSWNSVSPDCTIGNRRPVKNRRTDSPGDRDESSTSGVVVIGISTGGPAALAKVLPELPANFPLPVLVVQHLPASFTHLLANDLNQMCSLPVSEATHREEILPGRVYIAPGGRQMKVANSATGQIIRVTDSPPENHCCPSVDFLLRSVATIYGDSAQVVIMTGMGTDGTAGCEMVTKQGGSVITQSAESCVVYGMPRSVVEAGLSQDSFPLDEIAGHLIRTATAEGTPCQR